MIAADRGLRLEPARLVLRWLLAAAYLFVGIAHIRSPGTFLAIIPLWVPYPHQTIFLTGLCEIAGAIALLTRRLRWIAGVMLAAYAVCVFPANIRHAVEGLIVGGNRLGWWYHGPRLAFQPVIVWWALFAGSVIDWPFGKSRRAEMAQAPVPIVTAYEHIGAVEPATEERTTMTTDSPKPEPSPVTAATERPLVEPAEQVVAPDPLDEVRPVAACLSNDADGTSDAGSITTDHDAVGWKADPLAKP